MLFFYTKIDVNYVSVKDLRAKSTRIEVQFEVVDLSKTLKNVIGICRRLPF